ncbi:hypothetical protein [Lentilactobacillus hilgardii]|uniref:Uncharacterized protein n=1 Tax=Lentilactobacillus hilgardii TaxID=1588 RepID=A0A6P1E6R3_LENHI|nr:hypothetical protein [Lentilactobacillus hilgardii]MCT3393097.1 hypothetical protein [Lentilactobacillus hilgardii]QHB51365.1 hypothetical protein GQR93_03605 [Lentilactobacillus hilgardii]RRG10333.1 MAG: hypothetical protein DUD35_07975 [Lactobacillus sp.]
MKLKRFADCVAALCFIGIGVISNAQSVSAAGWRKGVPRSLCGNYKCKTHQHAYPHWGVMSIHANYISEMFQGDPQSFLTQVRYKAVGHYTYKLNGFAKSNTGNGHGDHETWIIRRSGKRINVRFNSYNAGQWYSRVH